MAISQYWVGQIPARPIAIEVRDSNGNVLNLTNYNSFNVRMLDPKNKEVDTSGLTVNTGGIATGRLVLRLPTDRSLFDLAGDYVLQLEFVSATAKDYTTTHTLRVRKLGGDY